MHKEESKINCPTFQKQNLVIKDIADRINMTKNLEIKATFAQELQKNTDELLSCPDYASSSLSCRGCFFIANLRMKTANMIIKAKELTK